MNAIEQHAQHEIPRLIFRWPVIARQSALDRRSAWLQLQDNRSSLTEHPKTGLDCRGCDQPEATLSPPEVKNMLGVAPSAAAWQRQPVPLRRWRPAPPWAASY